MIMQTATTLFNNTCDHYRQRLADFLHKQLSDDKNLLTKAMNYALLNGGKRIRPLLVYHSGQLFNADLTVLDHCAAAIESIHAFSLVHDDLPAMDDDDFRRGQPSCHRQFDEATAILAGDALQTFAFELLSQPLPLNTARQLQLIQLLATATGRQGMTGGQALDLQAQTAKLNLNDVLQIHQLKTGCLISASTQLGAIAGDATKQELAILQEYANKLGLAFQLQDDLFDEKQAVEKTSTELSMLNFISSDDIRNQLANLKQQAFTALTQIDRNTEQLSNLTTLIFQRQH